jgi:hypothetical protein
MAREKKARGVAAEFRFARLGDERRLSRLKQLAEALESDPSASFPDATETEAELEGTYRFLGNEAVTPEKILAGHYRETVERAEEHKVVLAVHDTTFFDFSSSARREGLGLLRGKGQGFLGHVTLLLADDTVKRPLGVIALQTLVRGAPPGRRKNTTERREAAEPKRWQRGVELAAERLDGRSEVIHVMDREADSYTLWAALIEGRNRFVIRRHHDRYLANTRVRLSEHLPQTSTIVERMVHLSARPEKSFHLRRFHPARAGRLARLALSATSVELRRAQTAHPGTPLTLRLNIVEVREIGTHGDNEPVHWSLATTESIATAADVERIVDCYRARWVIEEYFKAIKTGCAYEKRQLESFHTLVNALAVFVPIAWRLLLLRTLSRDASGEPVTNALTQTQVDVLKATSKKPLPKNLTVSDAMLAVARLGGHIKNNGQPGWIVIGRGFEKLLALEQGWVAALALRSDQS